MSTAPTMRGPADPDRFRVNTGGARRYRDTLPACPLRPQGPHPDGTSVPAMSTVKRAEGKGGLVHWAGKTVATAAVTERDAWTNMADDDAVEWLTGAPDRNKNRAATRGTSVHAIVERLLDGRGLSAFDGDAGADYLDSVRAFVNEWQPDLRYAEVVAFGNVDGDEWAGTFDAIVGLGPLGLVMVDYKSRSPEARDPHRVYPGEVCQLGGYSDADYIIVEDPDTGQAVRQPMPDLNGLALVTFTPDAYDVHPIDLGEAREAWRRLHGWWKGEQIARGAVVNRRQRPYPPHKVKPLEEMTKDELLARANGDYDLGVAKGLVKADIIAAIRAHEGDEHADTMARTDAELSAPTETEVANAITEPADEGIDNDVAAAQHAIDLDELRNELGRHITTLLNIDGGEDALRQRWPAGVPTLAQCDTAEQLNALGNAVIRAEADVAAPFDPPPTEPVTRRPVPGVDIMEPGVDEGPDVPPDTLGDVAAALRLLEPDQEAWLNDIVAAAGNLNLRQKPSLRRARLAWALVRLAAANMHELIDAVITYAGVDTGPVDGGPGRRLAVLSADHALKVSETVTDLIADRLELHTNPDGTYLLLPF